MHICIKCFVQRRIQDFVTHTHTCSTDTARRSGNFEAATNGPDIMFQTVGPLAEATFPREPPVMTIATPRASERLPLSEEDLTTLDKEELNRTYSTLTQIQEAAEARGQYAHFYDALTDKTRQRGQEMLFEALKRKSAP